MNFESNATALLEYYHRHKDSKYIEDARPRGFKFVGSGSFRACYAKDGWVYKVPRYTGARENNYNFREYEEYLRLVDLVLPDYIILPATEILEVSCEHCDGDLVPVIVMEEVHGDFVDYHRCQIDLDYRALVTGMGDAMGLHDITGTNVIINEDGWWPIDLHI